MAEILTESFCERCGTRYTFESTERRPSPLGTLGTVGRGLRNFVASPDASLDEAFAAARAETEQRATAHQLEAFHRTFNFCLSCRQYSCADCWNPVEGRCLTCSPLPEREVTAEPASHGNALRGFATDVTAIAWPAIDGGTGFASNDVAATQHEVEPTALEAAEAPEPAEPAALEAAEPAEPEPPAPPTVAQLDVAATEPAAPEPMPAITEAFEPAPDRREARPESAPAWPPSETPRRRSTLPFAAGVSLDEEIAAYDLRMAALAKAPPEPAVVPPTPIVPAPPAAPRRQAASAQKAGRGPIAMPAPPRAVVPELPPADAGLGTAEVSTGTCPSCGLSLSASARFCRRCGTQQRVQVRTGPGLDRA
jgi:hypothetical protein